VVQMGKLDAILTERRRLAARYTGLLSGDERILTPYEPPTYHHTYQSYCIRLGSDARLSRVSVMRELAGQGIATRRGVMATHLEPCYRASTADLSLPITEAAAAETLLLPLYAGMSDGDQDIVVAALRRAMG
jgi:perosamine synthetase